jgi:FkbM family methyltransferase
MMKFLKYFLRKFFSSSKRDLEGSVKDVREDCVTAVFYKVGDYNIELGVGHKLPDYQREHPLYDRYLPNLAATLPSKSLVVDIGANVGDTYAGMVSANRNLRFICVEPDEDFFCSLQQNAQLIASSSQHELNSPLLINCFIGVGESAGNLVKANGSARLVESEDLTSSQVRFVSLAELIHSNRKLFDDSPVIVIKSDVDGFDHAVIESYDGSLDSTKIIWFFEAQADVSGQMEAFCKAVRNLEMNGNVSFAVFDNFGGLMARECSADSVVCLLRYVDAQNRSRATRTIWYLDVLAYPSALGWIIGESLVGYQGLYID